MVAACLPDPATLGDRMHGKTCAGLWVRGTGKDGRPRSTYLYHVVDNEWSMREYGSQAVVWQTAVNPIVALELIDRGMWTGAGVLGPEAFDPCTVPCAALRRLRVALGPAGAPGLDKPGRRHPAVAYTQPVPAGYSGTPLPKKLGVKDGNRLTLVGAPPDWTIDGLPAGVQVARKRTVPQSDVVVAFFRDQATLRRQVPGLSGAITADAALWLAWPRRAGGHRSDITDNTVRYVALPLGLVDVKVVPSTRTGQA